MAGKCYLWWDISKNRKLCAMPKGKLYVDEYMMDTVYDDKYEHVVNLDESGLKLGYRIG